MGANDCPYISKIEIVCGFGHDDEIVGQGGKWYAWAKIAPFHWLYRVMKAHALVRGDQDQV